MNGFINTLLSVTLSWIRALVNQIWQLLNSKDGGSLFGFFSRNWLAMVIILCAACVLVDGFVYFFRWRPDYVWASRWRRLRRKSPRAQEAPQQAALDELQPVLTVQAYAPAAPAAQQWQPAADEAFLEDEPLWDSEEPADMDWLPEEEASFGAPQPEPLAYFRDVQAGFAPAVPPEQLYAPPARMQPQPEPEMVHPGLDEETFRQNLGLDENAPSPQQVMYAPVFRPFTVTHEPEPEKPHGAFQRLAQRARDFMALDDEPRSIRDLQSNVDVSKAFHEPVYPQSFNRDEE